MNKLHLYIDRQPADMPPDGSFEVYFRRTLLSPAQFAAKDAQCSYDITLPATAANNAILGYGNSEEVRGKFTRIHDATLYAGNIKLFDGKFRLTETAKTHYRGNLGMPAPKSLADIFAEKYMNQTARWAIPFASLADAYTYNSRPHTPCIFPLVLYGLIPKGININGKLEERKKIDSDTQFNIKHFPPSANCLMAMRHVFADAGYALNGTAFDDERLARLYMSYHNPDTYAQPWNYGNMFKIHVEGSWGNYNFRDRGVEIVFGYNAAHKTYSVNLFDCRQATVRIKSDPGGMLKQSIRIDESTQIYINQTHIAVPQAGLYKITFDSQLTLHNQKEGITNVEHNGTRYFAIKTDGVDLGGSNFETKLIRIPKGEQLDLAAQGISNNYRLNARDASPRPLYSPWSGNLNFIDPEAEPHLLCGMWWGKNARRNGADPTPPDHKCSLIAIKGGYSWGNSYKKRISAAVNCDGYYAFVDGKYRMQKKPKLKVDLHNSPGNSIEQYGTHNGKGRISQIVWLDEGDSIAVVATSEQGQGIDHSWLVGWIINNVSFDLKIEAFRVGEEAKKWIRLDDEGTGTEPMDWNDTNTFGTDSFDLAKFLPSDTKVDEWVTNFCKTFNLDLRQTGEKSFALDTRRRKDFKTSLLIDLDRRANVDIGRVNTPLMLPEAIDLGFKVDRNEQGFREGCKTDDNQQPILETGDEGSGTIETGSMDGKRTKISSNFSYCWYTDVEVNEYGSERTVNVSVPIVSDKDVWNDANDTRAQERRYESKTQRLWYNSMKTTELPVGPNIFDMQFDNRIKRQSVNAAIVSGSLEAEGCPPLRLTYENEPNTITGTYFAQLADVENHYTTVQCHLTPDEYREADNSLVLFNGDVYLIAEIDGYDPTCRKQATLKLIRKMV